MATQLNTIQYSLGTCTPSISGSSFLLTPNISGDFSYYQQNNACTEITFFNGVATYSADQSATVGPNNTAGIDLTSLGGVNYGVVNAIWYFGSATKFDSLSLVFAGTPVHAAGTMAYEYWNGTTWVAMAQSGASQRVAANTGALTLLSGPSFSFSFHPDILDLWEKTTVNGGSSRYFIRLTNTATALTVITLQTVGIQNIYDNYGYNKFDKIFTTTNDSAFTDQTLIAHSGVAAAFTYTANTTNARMYLGCNSNNLLGWKTTASTAGTVGQSIWEYWNGSTWKNLPVYTEGTPTTTAGQIDWIFNATVTYFIIKDLPTDWVQSSINGFFQYWIRNKVIANYTVSPVFGTIQALRDQSYSRTIYIPEETNRTFKSVFAKVHQYNPIITPTGRIAVQARIDANHYVSPDVGTNINLQTTFTSISGAVFTSTANDAVFLNNTGQASNSSAADVTVTNTGNSNLYFIFPPDSRFKNNTNVLQFVTPGSLGAGGAVVWEYWNGSAWTSFVPIVYNADQHLNQKVAATIYVVIPCLNTWSIVTVNSYTGYAVRRRITTVYTTSPTTYSQVGCAIPGFNPVQYTITAGKNNSHSFLIDMTEIFNSQFTGTSGRLDLKIAQDNTLGAVGGVNPVQTIELFVTYACDDQATRIKTVTIPLDTTSTALTSSLVSVGSSQFPNLSTYLPEASKVIRNCYIVLQGNDCNTSLIPTQIGLKLGSDPVRYTWGQLSSGISSTPIKYIYCDDTTVTQATRDIKMSLQGKNVNFKNFSLHAVVTYEYDSSQNNRVLNSIIVPWTAEGIFLPQADVVTPENIRKTFVVQEPGTIDNEKIGCYLSFTDGVAPRLRHKEKSETAYGTLVWTGTNMTGGYKYGWVLPSQDLSRGNNTIGVDLYGEYQGANLQSGGFASGYFVVNYQSDKADTGAGTHNKNISYLGGIQLYGLRASRFCNRLSTPLSNYYINDFGINAEAFISATVLVNCFPMKVFNENAVNTSSPKTEVASSGINSTVARTIYSDFYGENEHFKRYPGDSNPDNVLNIYSPNMSGGNWMMDFGLATTIATMTTMIAQHEITYTATGSVIGYSGDGSGLTVTFYDSTTQETLFTCTTIAGGTFSGTWYDNVRTVLCDVYDPTLNLYAESAPQIVTSPFTLTLRRTTSVAYAG